MNHLAKQLASLQADTRSPREIALTRQRLLENEQSGGLPFLVQDVLKEAIEAFWTLINSNETTTNRNHDGDSIAEPSPSVCLSEHVFTRNLQGALEIHANCTKFDACLGAELAAQGTHQQLRRIIQWDILELGGIMLEESNIDTVIELQDMACEIAALYSNFPAKPSPFSHEVLTNRLPLTFRIQSDAQTNENLLQQKRSDETSLGKQSEEVVLIHQVTQRQSAQEDVGFGKCSFQLLSQSYTVCIAGITYSWNNFLTHACYTLNH
jgi:hypothetical protein